MNLADRFYTSTEVAEILGVSLRSVYRYLEEDKLQAEVKTATGRHRFTKQNILDFLYPGGTQRVTKDSFSQGEDVYDNKKPAEDFEVSVQPDVLKKSPETLTTETADDVTSKDDAESDEEVDWLAKFRAAAEKYREAKEKPEGDVPAEKETLQSSGKIDETKGDKEYLSSLANEDKEDEVIEEPKEESAYQEQEIFYYQSKVGGLKELAQYINSTAKKSNVPYAFTMNAGLSLHKLIRPFSILHIYARPEDKEFFERALELVESDKNSAQLGILLSRSVFDNVKEVHSLYVVSDAQLRKDLLDAGELDLASELDEALNL